MNIKLNQDLQDLKSFLENKSRWKHYLSLVIEGWDDWNFYTDTSYLFQPEDINKFKNKEKIKTFIIDNLCFGYVSNKDPDQNKKLDKLFKQVQETIKNEEWLKFNQLIEQNEDGACDWEVAGNVISDSGDAIAAYFHENYREELAEIATQTAIETNDSCLINELKWSSLGEKYFDEEDEENENLIQ